MIGDESRQQRHRDSRGAQVDAFFEERTDLELAAVAGTSRDVITAFGVACGVGFIDIAVLPRDPLSAVPTL